MLNLNSKLLLMPLDVFRHFKHSMPVQKYISRFNLKTERIKFLIRRICCVNHQFHERMHEALFNKFRCDTGRELFPEVHLIINCNLYIIIIHKYKFTLFEKYLFKFHTSRLYRDLW